MTECDGCGLMERHAVILPPSEEEAGMDRRWRPAWEQDLLPIGAAYPRTSEMGGGPSVRLLPRSQEDATAEYRSTTAPPAGHLTWGVSTDGCF